VIKEWDLTLEKEKKYNVRREKKAESLAIGEWKNKKPGGRGTEQERWAGTLRFRAKDFRFQRSAKKTHPTGEEEKE